MRLFTILALGACATFAQDSPIIINDNGNVPFFPKEPKSDTRLQSQGAKDRPPGNWSLYETHVHYEGTGGIRQDPKTKEIFIDDGYKAFCFEDTAGHKFLLDKEEPWSITTRANRGKTVLSLETKGSSHVHIKKGKYYNPPYDLDHPDAPASTGTNHRLKGVDFRGAMTSIYSSTGNSYKIHYCGPKGCQDAYGVDQCAGATLMNPAPQKPAAKK